MRSEPLAFSPNHRRSSGDRVERLLNAAFADEPRFREAFLQFERARRGRTASDALDCLDAASAAATKKRA
jgi:hypothetical protein